MNGKRSGTDAGTETSLRAVLESQHSLTVDRAVRLAVGAVDQLSAAVSRSTPPLRLAPEDIVVRKDGSRVLATLSSVASDTDGEFPSPYASPEVRAGGPPNERTAVWSVGALLYEMLAGEPPRAAPEESGPAADAISHRDDVPEELAVLIYRMLDADPDLRPQGLESVRAELQRILHALDGANRPAGGDAVAVPQSVSLAGDARPTASDDQALLFATTPFVGRERELAELRELLADPQTRLITLVGPGGIGKSRLAFQVAQSATASFPDGVHFVPLSAVRSPVFIPLAVGNALDLVFRGSRDPKDQLLGYLQGRCVLLVLDDFDQLLEGAALLQELLKNTEGLRLLVTSRERLNLRLERLFDLGGLEVPEEGCGEAPLEFGSVRLFSEAAARVTSDFRFEAEQAHVVRICRLLEGMPLGIELAAGWTRVLGCKDIADEISRDAGFLAGDQPDVPERHRGIRATFDRSWAFLTDKQRRVLAGLSVFRGGFRREAAEAVAGATLPLLSAFVDKSLVRRDEFDRYRIHEMLRQYLNDRLGESPECLAATTDRHCAWHAEFIAARLRGGWKGRRDVREVEEEFGNIQKAWEWAVENLRANDVRRMVAPLFTFYRTCGWYAAGEEVLGAAAQRIRTALGAKRSMPEAAEVLGSILVRQAAHRFDLGDYRGCQKLLVEAHSLLDEESQPKELALAYRIQSNAAVRQGQYEDAQRSLGEVRRIGVEIHDRSLEGDALQELGNIAMHLARYGEAERLSTEALEIHRALGHPRGMAVCLNTLGNVAYNTGRHAGARRCYEESLVISRKLGNRLGESAILANLGNIASISGDHGRAKVLCKQSLDIAREIGFHRGVAHGLYLLGGVYRNLGDYDAAETHLEESLVLYERSGDRRGAAYSLTRLGQVWHERGDYEQARKLHHRALTIFRELDVPRGVAVVLSRLGDSALASGDTDQARQHYREGVKVAAGIGAAAVALWGVLGWARSCRARNNPGKAAQLAAFVSVQEASGDDSRTEASELLVELASELSTEELEAARAKGRSRALEDVVEELVGGGEPAAPA